MLTVLYFDLFWNILNYVPVQRWMAPHQKLNGERVKTDYTALRKHAYSTILKILETQKGKFSEKKKTNSDIFHISDQNIDCGYSLEVGLTSAHNLCSFSKIRKIMYTPVNPSFTI